MANHKKGNKRRSKAQNKQIMSQKLRKQREKSDTKQDSMYAAHRGWGGGKAK